MKEIETWTVKETSRQPGGNFIRYDGVELRAAKHQPYLGRVGKYLIRISNLIVDLDHPGWWRSSISECHADGRSTVLRHERGPRDVLVRFAVEFVRELEAKGS